MDPKNSKKDKKTPDLGIDAVTRSVSESASRSSDEFLASERISVVPLSLPPQPKQATSPAFGQNLTRQLSGCRKFRRAALQRTHGPPRRHRDSLLIILASFNESVVEVL